MKLASKILAILLLEAACINAAYWAGFVRKFPLFNYGTEFIVSCLPFLAALAAFRYVLKTQTKWPWSLAFILAGLGLWLGMVWALNQFGS